MSRKARTGSRRSEPRAAQNQFCPSISGCPEKAARDQLEAIVVTTALVDGLDAFGLGGTAFFGFRGSLLLLRWPFAMMLYSFFILRATQRRAALEQVHRQGSNIANRDSGSDRLAPS